MNRESEDLPECQETTARTAAYPVYSISADKRAIPDRYISIRDFFVFFLQQCHPLSSPPYRTLRGAMQGICNYFTNTALPPEAVYFFGAVLPIRRDYSDQSFPPLFTHPLHDCEFPPVVPMARSRQAMCHRSNGKMLCFPSLSTDWASSGVATVPETPVPPSLGPEERMNRRSEKTITQRRLP